MSSHIEQMSAPQPSALQESGAALQAPAIMQDAPIASLPRELILKIVELGVDDSFSTLPIVASHVCSEWRTLTLGNPLLWTAVCIKNLHSGNPTDQLECASAFAARSSEFALTVFVNLSPPVVSLEAARGFVSSIATFIARYKDRIRNLYVRYTPEFQSVGVAAMVPPALASVLEACSVQCVSSNLCDEYPAFEGSSDQIIVPAFQLPEGGLDGGDQAGKDFTSLGDLTLTATALVWGSFAPSSLRCLTLHDLTSATAPTWTELWDMLKANASTLADLDLGWVYPLGRPTPEPFEMPALRKLRLAYTNSRFLLVFATVCHAQSLEELHLHNEADSPVTAPDPAQPYAFAAVLTYMPLPKIRYLHLSRIVFPPVRFRTDPMPIAFLRRLCVLERLKLTDPDPHTLAALNSFMPHLWCTEPDAGEPSLLPVAPQLSRLTLRRIHPATFIDFVSDRVAMMSAGPVPVRRLDVLDFRIDWEASDAARYAEAVHDIVELLNPLA